MTWITTWPGQEEIMAQGLAIKWSNAADQYEAEFATIPAPFPTGVTDGEDDYLVEARTNEELLAIARTLRRRLPPDVNYE